MAIAQIERENAANGRGCLGKARDDEPVFILRAQDAFASYAVETWARTVLFWLNMSGASHDEEACARTRAKAYEALGIVADMIKWQEKHGSKAPD